MELNVSEYYILIAALEVVQQHGGGSPEHTLQRKLLEHSGLVDVIPNLVSRYTVNVLREVAEQFDEA